jgi:hypothetical protein
MEDETWFCHYEQQVMEWHHDTAPRKKKLQNAIS